jgi:hypothetical protein
VSTLIAVTAEHITEGKRGDCEICPVALAARLAFPDAGLIRVDQETLFVHQDGRITEYDLPAEAWRFVIAFDRRNAVEPFSFTVSPSRSYDADPVTS